VGAVIKAPVTLAPDVAAIWVEVVTEYGTGYDRIVGPALEAYCGQVSRLREAARRISAEGLVVADAKGQPVPHPALAIERGAQEEIRRWGNAFAPKKRANLYGETREVIK